MTCAMRLHDPCDGPVDDRRIPGGPRTFIEGVPLCHRHRLAWVGRCGPFRTFTRNERANWSKWAADRARRQSQQQETTA